MIQKQTVYLPVNGVSEKYVISDNDSGYFNGVIEQKGYFFTPEQLNEYTANVIKQALEIAAERVKDEIACDYESTVHYNLSVKPSIKSSFDETYKQFSV